ncbi:MAG: radical SAM family heme chaperone HemW [Clostridia bacterium]|nr:radical SAM family heme chaperone HemW [Clostridia bacterium]
MMIKALYIHIPFCLAKCKYCDFNSYPLSVFERTRKRLAEAYLAALRQEILLLLKDISLDEIETIYMGGGTPTILDTDQLVSFMEFLKSQLNFSRIQEATIEANPGTVSLEKLLALKGAGFNRISIGIQSLDNWMLGFMGRTHNAEEAAAAVSMARETGWENINVDLIYGLPNQSTAMWEDTLAKVMQLNPDHVSSYGLKLENNTPWGRDYSNRQITLPEDEAVYKMYESLQRILKDNGYIHYEISNYCKTQKTSKHNSIYWQNEYYLGAGIGAASFYNSQRFYNVKDIDLYMDSLAKGLRPLEEAIDLTLEEQMSETMFMKLRLLSGMNILDFKNRFGISPIDKYYDGIKKLVDLGLIHIQRDAIRLTEKGIPLANLVFMEFV